ncbi:MAG: radical SAM protein [candidate division Zixibacteria bacterium]
MNSKKPYNYVKGLSKSDNLGSVLSVDFNPKKICSFDCIYCGVGRTTDKTLLRQEFYPVEEVYGEIRDWIDENSQPEFALLTGSGEPMLYLGLGRLARLIKSNIPGLKLIVYSNGSLLKRSEVRQEISVIDQVIINLNSADEDILLKICRPHRDFRFDELIDSIKQFRKEFRGILWIDVVLIKGINTSAYVLEKLLNTIEDISPDRCTIGQPKSKSKDGTNREKVEISEELRKKWSNLPFRIDYNI